MMNWSSLTWYDLLMSKWMFDIFCCRNKNLFWFNSIPQPHTQVFFFFAAPTPLPTTRVIIPTIKRSDLVPCWNPHLRGWVYRKKCNIFGKRRKYRKSPLSPVSRKYRGTVWYLFWFFYSSFKTCLAFLIRDKRKKWKGPYIVCTNIFG